MTLGDGISLCVYSGINRHSGPGTLQDAIQKTMHPN